MPYPIRMRGIQPGGRFDIAYETSSLLDGIDSEVTKTVGTVVQWWVYNSAGTTVDPIYDVGSIGGGRLWHGPFNLPVIKALVKQGVVQEDVRGFYNTESIHLLIDAEDAEAIYPNVFMNPELQDRSRIVWNGSVYRPNNVQPRAIIANQYTLLFVECLQVMPEEMVNDTQFVQYASPVPDTFEELS